jgi:hypothetical protein
VIAQHSGESVARDDADTRTHELYGGHQR